MIVELSLQAEGRAFFCDLSPNISLVTLNLDKRRVRKTPDSIDAAYIMKTPGRNGMNPHVK